MIVIGQEKANLGRGTFFSHTTLLAAWISIIASQSINLIKKLWMFYGGLIFSPLAQVLFSGEHLRQAHAWCCVNLHGFF